MKAGSLSGEAVTYALPDKVTTLSLCSAADSAPEQLIVSNANDITEAKRENLFFIIISI
jgi:hypothetical protein